jgi:hypothetical protein
MQEPIDVASELWGGVSAMLVTLPATMRLALVLLASRGLAVAAQAPGAIVGSVITSDGRPVEGARVRAERGDRGDSASHEGLSDAGGAFRIGGLTAGIYAVSARRIGYRVAEMPALRVAVGQTATLRITLSEAARQLSAIIVVMSPLTIDASTTELPSRVERQDIAVLPTGHDASSLIALVPGARQSSLWGGAGAVANDYKLDGISVNHPGTGGDFLQMPIDWIDALEIRGLGAGAEFGNFQGGVVNAVTKTGTNVFHAALRTNYESPRLDATNLNLNEVGSEQAGRREVAGELLGPVMRDRLFFFLAGQHVLRDVRAPNLATAALDYQPIQESHRDDRTLGKLTWLPASGERVDLLAGLVASDVGHAGLNGIDDPSALAHQTAVTTFYQAGWTLARDARNTVELKLGGFTGRESQLGYAGPLVPAVQLLQLGRQPSYQNADFDERVAPSSLAGTVAWRAWRHAFAADHHVVIGGEVERTAWRDDRTRNAGLTWRPYTTGVAGFNPADASTWATTGSDWGGDSHVQSDAENDALFAQDDFTVATNLTFSLGARYGQWSAWLTPPCDSVCRPRFHVVTARAIDPRAGLVWDVTGRSDLTLKLHWGRYHQGMFPLFVDRAQGANAYTNERFYYAAPRFTDSRTVYTPTQRDALLADTAVGGNGFSPFYDETILNESGRVDGYRQPYVDQTMFAVEKALGSQWKAEVLYTDRANGDIVGLVDRNMSTNYSPLSKVRVTQRLGFGNILDANGRPLVLPVVYVSNQDLVYVLSQASRGPPARVGPYTVADIPNLKWKPDIALAAIPGAERKYDQLTFTLRTSQPNWRADGSITAARLRGNTAGVTGHGTVGTQFTAGPFVRPNEATNYDGDLPDASHFEGKVWLTARLPHALQAGLICTHVLGESFTPTFQLNGRYRYAQGDTLLADELFRQVIGQTIFVEPRGSRHYASRTIVDSHLDWQPWERGRPDIVLTADIFNLTGSHAITSVKTTIDDQAISDPTSYLGAPRLRVPSRTLRLGLRIE